MKAIKLLIFAVLFVAGQQAIAQDIYVNNNMAVQVDITFILMLYAAKLS